MEALLLSLLGAILVNSSTYLGKIQNGEKFDWLKAFRTIFIGGLVGALGVAGDLSAGLSPAIYTAASAGITGVLDQGLKAGYRWIIKTLG